MATNEENADFDLWDEKSETPVNLEFERLVYLTIQENKEFQETAKYLDFSFYTYPVTADYLNSHINIFTQRLKDALDKDFLINAELERLKNYINPENLKKDYENDFTARGFYWALTGEPRTIKDFFYLVRDTHIELYSISIEGLPETTEQLKAQWEHLPTAIDRTALGYSYAMYVKYLNVIKSELTKDNTNTKQPEKKEKSKLEGLPVKAKVLLLYELGFFDNPKTENSVATKLAKIVSELISNGKDYQNIRAAIGLKGRLRKKLQQTNDPGTLEAIDKIDDLLEGLNK